MLSKIIRVRREDSAFVYAVFESLEGMAAYSTVQVAGLYCDLSLEIPFGFIEEVETVLAGLRKKIPIVEIS